MMICPLAPIRPAICDGSGPSTRFSATEPIEGWLNRTDCWLPISKLCQLMAARGLDWSMVVVVAFCAMAAAPAVTTPPVG